MGIFYWFQRNGIDRMHSFDEGETLRVHPSVPRMGVRQNFAVLFNSKYLLSIAIVVLSYNIFANLTEVIWKDQLRALCENSNQYNIYMGKVVTWTGVISIFIAVVINGFIHSPKWTTMALAPPLILLFTGIGFFLFLMFNHLGLSSFTLFGCTPLVISTFFGSSQNCLMRSLKYTIFESTKEIAFIPLDHESKLKGKAAIDGIGSRMGKSGGAMISQGLLFCLGTLSASIPYVAAILLCIIFIWIWAVKDLGQQFEQMLLLRKKKI
jgi:AAA family ATP:ADP antiporter